MSGPGGDPDTAPARGFDAAWAAVAGVEGWMTEGQGRELFAAAAACPPDGRIVEIGSYHGRSTIVLALAAPPGAEIVAIDPHAGTDRGPGEIAGYAAEADHDHRAFVANLAAAGVDERVVHVRMFSDRALDAVAPRPGARPRARLGEPDVDVLYVDGAHRYAPARADLHDWGARVVDGGTMLVHDAFSSVGVTLAILRELVPGGRFRYVGRSRSLAIYRADLSGPRAANAVRQIAQLPWFVRNLALKALLTAGLGTVLRRLGRRPPEWPY